MMSTAASAPPFVPEFCATMTSLLPYRIARSVVLRHGRHRQTGDAKGPEGPSARLRTDPAATVGPSGQVLRGTLAAGPGLLGLPLSLGFGAFRTSPPGRLVGLPNRTSRCAQSALRLSQGVPLGFPFLPLRLLGARRILRTRLRESR